MKEIIRFGKICTIGAILLLSIAYFLPFFIIPVIVAIMVAMILNFLKWK